VSDRWWAVVMILVVLAITAVMALWMHDPAFVLVTVWASVGIGVEQWDRTTLVAIVAFIAALLAAVLAVVASLIAFEQQTVATALPQSVPPKHRSSVLTRGRRSDSGDRD
jgi:cytochrome c-type biogenesis protein CcmE